VVKLIVQASDLLDVDTPMLAIGVYEDEEIGPQAARVDSALAGAIRLLKEAGEVSGKRNGVAILDDGLASGLVAAGEVAGERLWRMPLWKEYREQIKAPLGDFKNVGGSPAGSITAAWFLANFAGDTPWAHLDIAGTARTEGSWASIPPYMQRDVGTGVGVRLLAQFAKDWA
jgi:leucyl aminopeptidase